MNCEACNQQLLSVWGSGRFCNRSCANGYSSRENREAKNLKISKTLTKEPYSKICKSCEASFLTKKKTKTFCSRKCSSSHTMSREDVKSSLRSSRLREIEKGNIGYGIHCYFQDVRCDSALEYAFVKWYLRQNPGSKIERFKGYLPLSDGKKYQPDFLIDEKIIAEVKFTTPYVGERLSQKWKTYLSTQEEKQLALAESSYEFMWVTEKTIGLKFYRDCLEEVKSFKHPSE